MGVLPIDLYRIGDTVGPGLDLIRVGYDVVTLPVPPGGEAWVQAGTGGASTRAAIYRLRPALAVRSRWWRIPAGTVYPTTLNVFNDHGQHWVWEPAQDMPLADYVSALAGMNGRFV